MKKLVFLLIVLALTACEAIVIDPECVTTPTAVNDTTGNSIKNLSSSALNCSACHD